MPVILNSRGVPVGESGFRAGPDQGGTHLSYAKRGTYPPFPCLIRRGTPIPAIQQQGGVTPHVKTKRRGGSDCVWKKVGGGVTPLLKNKREGGRPLTPPLLLGRAGPASVSQRHYGNLYDKVIYEKTGRLHACQIRVLFRWYILVRPGTGVDIFTQGKTLDELAANIREAVELRFADALEKGETIRILSISGAEVDNDVQA